MHVHNSSTFILIHMHPSKHIQVFIHIFSYIKRRTFTFIPIHLITSTFIHTHPHPSRFISFVFTFIYISSMNLMMFTNIHQHAFAHSHNFVYFHQHSSMSMYFCLRTHHTNSLAICNKYMSSMLVLYICTLEWMFKSILKFSFMTASNAGIIPMYSHKLLSVTQIISNPSPSS